MTNPTTNDTNGTANPTTTTQEAARKQDTESRVERMRAQAARLHAEADGRDAKADSTLDLVPKGQPMRQGRNHAWDGRARQRAWNHQDRAASARAEARRLESLADTAEAHQRRHQNGRVTMRRLDEIRAGLRRFQAELDAAVTDSRREWLTESLAELAEKQRHWEGHMAKLAESGEFVPWGPEHFQAGDAVREEGGAWHAVKRVNKVSLSIDGLYGPTTLKWDKVAGRRRDSVQLDAPNAKPWPVKLAQKVSLWRHLEQVRGRGGFSEETMRAGWAQRIALGLPSDASDAEVEAFHLDGLDEDTARDVITVYVDIYRRLAAGEEPAAVRASVIPLPFEPEWRMPNRESEKRLAAPGGYNNPNPYVQVGDLLVGFYDIGEDRTLVKRDAGPVIAVSDVDHRYERGDWVTITLANGRTVKCKTHTWFAVHPAGTWETTREAKADEVASLTVEHAETARRDADRSCDPAPRPATRPDPWGPVLRALNITLAG